MCIQIKVYLEYVVTEKLNISMLYIFQSYHRPSKLAFQGIKWGLPIRHRSDKRAAPRIRRLWHQNNLSNRSLVCRRSGTGPFNTGDLLFQVPTHRPSFRPSDIKDFYQEQTATRQNVNQQAIPMSRAAGSNRKADQGCQKTFPDTY